MSNRQPVAGIGVGPRSPISAWFYHHRQAVQASYEKLLQAPVSNFLTILVIGVALALPYLGISIATARRPNRTAGFTPQLSLLLDRNVTYEEAERIREQVMRKPGIAR